MTQNLDVIYEDNHLIAINKKAGDIVQGDKTGDKPLSEKVQAYLKEKYNKPGNVYIGVVHRIDRPTSGVVLFARTSKAAARLSEAFREKKMDKTYWAVVKNELPKAKDSLTHYLKKDGNKNKSFAKDKAGDGYKKAVLHYELISKGTNYRLLEVKIETGRHHQIRCQLAQIGCPIKGDLKYGAKRSNKDGSISLHARQLSFKHPTTKEQLTLTAPVPYDALWLALEGEA